MVLFSFRIAVLDSFRNKSRNDYSLLAIVFVYS